MMYLVVYYEGCVGNHFDDTAKLFADKRAAETYRDTLNVNLAKADHCRVKDLGDYYEIIEIPVAEA